MLMQGTHLNVRATAGKVVKTRSVHLINYCGGGKVIALKSATALILDREQQAKKNIMPYIKSKQG